MSEYINPEPTPKKNKYPAVWDLVIEDMKSRGERPNNENAVKWLCEYENNHLYEQL